MPHSVVNIRMGYPIEYIPRGNRKVRHEIISEMFPCLVAEAEDLRPALSFRKRVTHFTDGSTVFEPVCPNEPREVLTISAFEEMQHKKLRALPMRKALVREDLRFNGLDGNIGEPTLRETLNFREIRSDGRDEAASLAQQLADRMVVHNGQVYITPRTLPSLIVTGSKTIISVNWVLEDANQIKHHEKRQVFPPNDMSGAWQFERELKQAFPGVNTFDLRHGQDDWTCHECPPAYWRGAWLIETAAKLAKNPLPLVHGNQPINPMECRRELVDAFLDLKDLTQPFSNVLPKADAMAEVEASILDVYRTIHSLNRQDTRKEMSILTSHVEWVLEVADKPLYEPDADIEALGSFAP